MKMKLIPPSFVNFDNGDVLEVFKEWCISHVEQKWISLYRIRFNHCYSFSIIAFITHSITYLYLFLIHSQLPIVLLSSMKNNNDVGWYKIFGTKRIWKPTWWEYMEWIMHVTLLLSNIPLLSLKKLFSFITINNYQTFVSLNWHASHGSYQ